MLWSCEEILQIVVKAHFTSQPDVHIPASHMALGKSLHAQLFEYLNPINLFSSSPHLVIIRSFFWPFLGSSGA